MTNNPSPTIQKILEEFMVEFAFGVNGGRNWMIIRQVKFLTDKLQEVEKESYNKGYRDGHKEGWTECEQSQ